MTNFHLQIIFLYQPKILYICLMLTITGCHSGFLSIHVKARLYILIFGPVGVSLAEMKWKMHKNFGKPIKALKLCLLIFPLKNKNEWLEASNTDKLNAVQYNYMLMNVDASKFLKSINFGSILRHLLYDKSGNLVHKSAPGPGSEEIQRLITYYSMH